MNNSRDLFEMWKSKDTRTQVENDAPDAARLFQLLSELAAEEHKAPLGFSAQVRKGVEQVIERRKVMRRLCLYGLVTCAALGLWFVPGLESNPSNHRWHIIESLLIAFVMVLAIFSAIATLGLKQFRVAGALTALALIVFAYRSQHDTTLFDVRTAHLVTNDTERYDDLVTTFKDDSALHGAPVQQQSQLLEEQRQKQEEFDKRTAEIFKRSLERVENAAVAAGSNTQAAPQIGNDAGLISGIDGSTGSPAAPANLGVSSVLSESAGVRVGNGTTALQVQEMPKRVAAAPLNSPQDSQSAQHAKGKVISQDVSASTVLSRRNVRLDEEITSVPPSASVMNDTERYGEYGENPWSNPRVERTSTFGLDIDTASYANMRRFIRLGQLPPPDSVRVEEFINYFKYQYPSPRDAPFGVTYEVAPSPLRPGYYLLRIGLKAKELSRDEEAGWNLVFLVDVSGSMNEANKLPLVKQSLKLLAQQMRAADRISIVTYAGATQVVLPSTSGIEQARILQAIDALDAGGSTYGSAGIQLAYSEAQTNFRNGAVNRVILATDGDFNVGVTNFYELMKLIEEKRQTGITLTTLGFGQGNINEHMMEQLANRGNGNFFYIDSFSEARKVLEHDLLANVMVVAKDTKIQLEFNPMHVAKYRLIGYDNRKLAHEDFANDAKDAGDIGSGHTVTALYELALVGSDAATQESSEYRYTVPTPLTEPTNLAHELGVLRIRFKEPEDAQSKLLEFPIRRDIVKSGSGSSDFRFATAVAGFGLILRQSAHMPTTSLRELITQAEGALGEDAANQRRELVELMRDAARLKN